MQDDIGDSRMQAQLEAWAADHARAPISGGLARRVLDALKPSLIPVKPVPSPRRLFLAFLVVFVAGSAGLIVLTSRAGLRLMTPVQLGATLAILLTGGILFSRKLAAQMIPGSRSGVPLWGLLTLGGIGVLGGLAVLFPWQSSGNFVSDGWPCAAMELVFVIPTIAVFWLLARRGALFASAALGVTLTALAVFLALAPLQSQCMFQQAPHLLVWHGGTALLSVGFGSLAGSLRRIRSFS